MLTKARIDTIECPVKDEEGAQLFAVGIDKANYSILIKHKFCLPRLRYQGIPK